MTHVAIAIVGFRNTADILCCLAALEKSTYRHFEVVICENGGPSAFDALVAQLPSKLMQGQRVRAVLAHGNLGYAGGVNRCLEETPDADAWWVLNPDTEPHANALELLVARLLRGDCEAVGCTIHLPDGTVQSYGGVWRSWLARSESMGHGASLEQHPDSAEIEAKQSYLNGAAMLISQRYLDRVGPMREDYFLYCEEVEWCLRALARGVKLGFADGALILHHQGTTTGNSGQLRSRARAPIYLNERNKLNVTRDTAPHFLPSAAVTLLIRIVLRYGRQRAWRQLVYALSGWGAGLRNERGPPA